MNHALRRILVIRNDKLGDFMLAWPALALLRASLPDAHIAVLVPAYTAPLAEICPSIHSVIIDPKEQGDWRNGRALAKLLRPHRFDAVITLFSRFDTGLAVWSAGIGYRLAPATKLAQMFYNHRLKQRRSESAKPEYEYNLDLIKYFLSASNKMLQLPLTPSLSRQGRGGREESHETRTSILLENLRDNDREESPLPAPPYLRFDESEMHALEQQFRHTHGIAAGRRLIFVHPGHGGSAGNLSLAQFAKLIHGLHSHGGHQVVLTAGPGEESQARELAALLNGVPHCVYISRDGLVKFARHLQFCDVFISGSTGPLHIAGALNCRTAAFYPRRRSSTALRWQTVNAADRRLAFEPPAGSGESDMQAVDVTSAAVEISEKYLQ